MNRELKFRSWDPTSNTMHPGFGFRELTEILTNPVENGPGAMKMKFALDSLVWMQFTGLKDKNEKEIYEGDIVKLIEPNRIYTVEWTEFSFKLIHADPKLDRMPWGSVYRVFELGWKIEVIGNIYQNPELLS